VQEAIRDGTGQVDSVQKAVDSIPNGSSTHIRIELAPGTYEEELTIAGRTHPCLTGKNATDTILTYDDSNARPWGAAGFAAFIGVELGAHIASAGFVPMSGNQPENARFHEYGSKGAGENAAARSSYQLTEQEAARYTLEEVLDGWKPSFAD